MLTEQNVRDAHYAQAITRLAATEKVAPKALIRSLRNRQADIFEFERGVELLKDYKLRFSSSAVELMESHAQELQGAVSPLVAVFSGYVGTVEKYTYAALFKKE